MSQRVNEEHVMMNIGDAASYNMNSKLNSTELI